MKLAYVVEESSESVRKMSKLFVVDYPAAATKKISYFHETDLMYRVENSGEKPMLVFAKDSLKKAYRAEFCNLIYRVA